MAQKNVPWGQQDIFIYLNYVSVQHLKNRLSATILDRSTNS
jgi:hypothetical protein